MVPRLLLSSALLDQGGPQLWIHTFWNYSQGFFPILDCWGYSASAYCGVPVCLLHDRSLSLASSKAILQQWAEQMLNIWMCTCVGVVLFDFFVCLFCVSIMFWQGGIWGLGGGGIQLFLVYFGCHHHHFRRQRNKCCQHCESLKWREQILRSADP